jgi:hypothetical protein
MASRYDRTVIGEKSNFTAGFTSDRSGVRSIIIDAASLDPLGATPTTTLPAGTVLGKVASTGKWKPVRRTRNAAAEVALAWDKVLDVDETTMFKVGDTVQLILDADGSAVDLGAITAIVAGTSIAVTKAIGADLGADAAYVEVTESAGASADTVCVLSELVDLLGPAGTAVDSPGVGFISCLDPVSSANIRMSAAGIDARFKTAFKGAIFI